MRGRGGGNKEKEVEEQIPEGLVVIEREWAFILTFSPNGTYLLGVLSRDTIRFRL